MANITDNTFESGIFGGNLTTLHLPGSIETVLDTSQVTSEQMKEALQGIGTFAILGYSSQGPAHAQNIRDSLEAFGLDEKEVVVGLREPSSPESEARCQAALDAGFKVVSPQEAARQADFMAMFISDAGQVANAKEYIDLLKPGSALGFGHGFYPLWLATSGQEPLRGDIDVIANCPKGMGITVRQLYEMGSGINSSFAVEQDVSGRATEVALAWAALIHSPFAFQTTLEKEAKSDLTGERAILLGGVDAITTAVYQKKANSGVSPQEAYSQTVESLVGPIAGTIQESGLLGLFDKIPQSEREDFIKLYNLAYPRMKSVTERIYEEISSGREIERVIEAGKNEEPMVNIADETMWRDNKEYRQQLRKDKTEYTEIDTTTAALYAAGLMAQVDTLLEKGHNWTEVVNESIIEAFASLLPFMKKGGVVEMVDGCSITARRGDRAWRGEFVNELVEVLDSDSVEPIGELPFDQFRLHPVHDALKKLSALQPKDDEGKPIKLVV